MTCKILDYFYQRANHGDGKSPSTLFKTTNPEDMLLVAKYTQKGKAPKIYTLSWANFDEDGKKAWAERLERIDHKPETYAQRKKSWRIDYKFDEVPEDFALEDFETIPELVQKIFDATGKICHATDVRTAVRGYKAKQAPEMSAQEKQLNAMLKRNDLTTNTKLLAIMMNRIKYQMAQGGSYSIPQAIKDSYEKFISKLPTQMSITDPSVLGKLTLAGYLPQRYLDVFTNGDLSAHTMIDDEIDVRESMDRVEVDLFYIQRPETLRFTKLEPEQQSLLNEKFNMGRLRQVLREQVAHDREYVFNFLNNRQNFKRYHVIRTTEGLFLNYIAIAYDMYLETGYPYSPLLIEWAQKSHKHKPILDQDSPLAQDDPCSIILT